MILVFGDTHIGYKFYGDSFNSKTGLVASEESAFRVFEEVYEIAQQSDIDLIIHTGDVFHSATPCISFPHLINLSL
jgi:DNA repair exonuclease SbcCD nuclease subunit